MGRFDRYILSQLLLTFGFFALVLVGVYWINRAVILIDRFMSAGQSGLLVFELSLLSLPALIKMVLPIAAFLAVLQTCNRLYSESELVVVQATGFSGFRLARPILAFGVLVGLILAVLAHLLVPLSIQRLDTKEAALAEAASSRLLIPGRFQHPVKGVTLYVRDIGPDGVMDSLLLTDTRNPNRETTYLAQRALLLQDDEGPKLVMFDGMAQALDLRDGTLSVTRFTDFTFGVASLIPAPKERRDNPRAIGTMALMKADEALQMSTRRDAGWLRREAHLRVAESLMTPALCVMGFAALMVGTFSRFGLWRQIALAVALAVVVKVVDNAAVDWAKAGPGAWMAVYAPSALTAALAVGLLALGGARRGPPIPFWRARGA